MGKIRARKRINADVTCGVPGTLWVKHILIYFDMCFIISLKTPPPGEGNKGGVI